MTRTILDVLESHTDTFETVYTYFDNFKGSKSRYKNEKI